MSDRVVLAQSAVTRVEICPCGACYVTIGPITMCLQAGVLGELGDSIAKALRRLRVERAVLLPASGGDGIACGDEDQDDETAPLGHVCALTSSGKN